MLCSSVSYRDKTGESTQHILHTDISDLCSSSSSSSSSSKGSHWSLSLPLLPDRFPMPNMSVLTSLLNTTFFKVVSSSVVAGEKRAAAQSLEIQ
ncbi:hypothetical protein ADUPG1_004481, partial [Aduncisulcus paluster]